MGGSETPKVVETKPIVVAFSDLAELRQPPGGWSGGGGFASVSKKRFDGSGIPKLDLPKFWNTVQFKESETPAYLRWVGFGGNPRQEAIAQIFRFFKRCGPS